MEKNEGCLHCCHNKNAVKPYVEMKRLSFTKATGQFLDKLEQEGQNASCFVCQLVSDFMKALKD